MPHLTTGTKRERFMTAKRKNSVVKVASSKGVLHFARQHGLDFMAVSVSTGRYAIHSPTGRSTTPIELPATTVAELVANYHPRILQSFI